MKLRRIACILILSVVLFQSCKKSDTITPAPPPVIQAPPGFGFYVVGYFPSYRTLSDVPDVKFRMCNVINYAFFSVNTANELTVNNATLVPQLIAKQ